MPKKKAVSTKPRATRKAPVIPKVSKSVIPQASSGFMYDHMQWGIDLAKAIREKNLPEHQAYAGYLIACKDDVLVGPVSTKAEIEWLFRESGIEPNGAMYVEIGKKSYSEMNEDELKEYRKEAAEKYREGK